MISYFMTASFNIIFSVLFIIDISSTDFFLCVFIKCSHILKSYETENRNKNFNSFSDFILYVVGCFDINLYPQFSSICILYTFVYISLVQVSNSWKYYE